jgi:hypothetical protein
MEVCDAVGVTGGDEVVDVDTGVPDALPDPAWQPASASALSMGRTRHARR